MSLHYIIDGYNVIKQVNYLTGRRLRDGRDGLVRFIDQYRPQGSRRNQVTIVFDGRAGVESPRPRSAVCVLFSRNESADDKIKRMVGFSHNARCLVIVTDDRDIIYYCRAAGARCVSVRDFLSSAAKPRAVSPEDATDKPDPDAQDGQAITEQLKHIWLQ